MRDRNLQNKWSELLLWSKTEYRGMDLSSCLKQLKKPDRIYEMMGLRYWKSSSTGQWSLRGENQSSKSYSCPSLQPGVIFQALAQEGVTQSLVVYLSFSKFIQLCDRDGRFKLNYINYHNQYTWSKQLNYEADKKGRPNYTLSTRSPL